MREQPHQQPPPVQRLRLRYAKRGRLRFTSHRDFSRAFERAVFRARIPMAYSSGFNPHPRISYAGAAPTGSASEAEYLEIALAEVIDPARAHADIDEALPTGLDVIEVVPSSGGALADRLDASWWRLTIDGISADEAQQAVDALLATDEVIVERMTKKGLRTFDARAAILSVKVAVEPEGAPGDSRPGARRVCDTRCGFATRFAVRETRRRSRRSSPGLRAPGHRRAYSSEWPRDRWTKKTAR